MTNTNVRVVIIVAAVVIATFAALLLWQGTASSSVEEANRSVALMYPGLILAMAAGLFGATFSMLVQIQRRTSSGTLDDIEAASSWHTLLVRCSFGVGAATILYFFFRSGLLEGSLWPKLTRLKFEPFEAVKAPPIIPNQDWCLLVIWSFVAGFSENFVPTILVKTEERGQVDRTADRGVRP